MEFQYRAIGKIQSPFKSKFAVPRQSGLIKEIHSKIQFKKSFQPEISLQGLQGFSHVWLLWSFHLNQSEQFKAKVSPPRLAGKKQGVFATRSPHRPNPIAMSVVELVDVGSDHIWVKGADLVDKTPILDIKPYIPEYDSIPGAQQGWLELVQDSIDHVEIDAACAEKFRQSFALIDAQRDFLTSSDLLDFLSRLIQQDPRPQQTRKNAKANKEDFVLDIYNFELFFHIKNRQAEIRDFKIKTGRKAG